VAGFEVSTEAIAEASHLETASERELTGVEAADIRLTA
jgi:hypothetical protein